MAITRGNDPGGAGIGIAHVGIDGGIAASHFFPIPDFASVNLLNLLDGEVAHRVPRIDDKHESVFCHRTGEQPDVFLIGILLLVAADVAGRDDDVVLAVNQTDE